MADYLTSLDRYFINDYSNVNYVSKELKELIEHVDNGFDQELSILIKEIIDKVKSIKILHAKGIYSNEYINSERKKYIEELQELRDKIYKKLQEYQEKIMSDIKKKYALSLSDHEINLKLLQLKQFESKLKASDEETLIKMASDFRNKNIGLDIDKLNMLIAEFRTRKMGNEAMSLSMDLKMFNVEEPWLNEKDYVNAEKEYKRLISYIGGNCILLNKKPMHTIIPIERLL